MSTTVPDELFFKDQHRDVFWIPFLVFGNTGRYEEDETDGGKTTVGRAIEKP